MNFPFGIFYTYHSGRMPNPTNYPKNFHPHGPCSYFAPILIIGLEIAHPTGNLPILLMSK
jgi:hypothetical protein